MGSRDSVSVNFDDFDKFKKVGMEFYYDYKDSLQLINLEGKNSTTFYGVNSKYNNEIKAEYLKYIDIYRYGGRFLGNFTSNEPLAKPSNHNFYISPSIGIKLKSFKSDLGVGFIHKKDDKRKNSGVNIYTENSYEDFISLNNYKVGNLNFNFDSMDSLQNYKGDVEIGLKNYLYQDDVYYGINAKYRINNYNYYTTTNNLNNVKNIEYEIDTSLDYDMPNGVNNSVLLNFKQNDKDSFSPDTLYSRQDISELGFGNRLTIVRSGLSSFLKIYYKNRREKFLINGNKDSFKNYRFSIESENFIRKFNSDFELKAKYMKYQYKSLKNENLNDKDIIQFGVYPSVKFELFNIILKQTVNYDFYKMVNISSLKSGNNHKNHNIKSRTNYLYIFNNNLKINGEISFNTRYQSYDYDSLNVKSFAIKNYSISDSLSFPIKRGTTYFTNKLSYEEYGRIDFDQFVMDPINHKHHIYNSIGITGKNKFISIGLEYFHYEIDTYMYDLEKFGKSRLSDVYIVHGPKLNLSLTLVKKWVTHLRIKYNLYREREELTLSIVSGYSF
ncbi:MAG: hypothetical protein CR982_04485 [Candidatus Cloacimonadota bacterium]|nr:MAG: hypothetical protein CR982_04485 [Candidatus Cloacimonadota bacterium]PIE80060.1 MAG: hypothetical protein CSA15_02245 [Candidatus Delongbacteria bacterium]